MAKKKTSSASKRPATPKASPSAKRRAANNGASDSLFPELPAESPEETAVALLEAEPEPAPSNPIEDPIESLGHAAGRVWHYLDEHGRVTITQLTRGLGLPRELVLQALGWLAREDKLVFDDAGHQRSVRLR